MKRTARELYELAMQNDSNTKSIMMFGHTPSDILEALELWECNKITNEQIKKEMKWNGELLTNEEIKNEMGRLRKQSANYICILDKERKMTREEAYKLSRKLGNAKPWYESDIDLLEALGLIKFDEAKPIESPPVKQANDKVEWKYITGFKALFEKDFDPNGGSPIHNWTKVENHQELINEAERYLDYEYSEFEKNFFYPQLIEVIKRLVEAMKSKSVIGHKFEDKELIIENANSKHEAVRISVARMKEVLEWRGYKVTKD